MIFRKKRESFRDLVIAYKQMFGTPQGRMVLFDLMNRYHVLNHHNGDALKEGQRSVVLDVMKKCNISVEQLDELLKGESS